MPTRLSATGRRFDAHAAQADRFARAFGPNSEFTQKASPAAGRRAVRAVDENAGQKDRERSPKLAHRAIAA